MEAMSANTDQSERNRQVVLEAWGALDSGRDASVMSSFFADGYIRHSGEGDYSLDEFAAVLNDLYAAFPDLSTDFPQVVAAGDKVAWRWVSLGTHLGPYMGVPPTHKRVTASGITISRLVDGVIVEDWASWNKVSVLHDLGIVPLR
jgi:steroid delta-isomerase-like uncharacterized protein